GHPADVMDMSFADQALAAEWLVNQGDQLSADVHILPREIDEEVARLKLESMGASLETLTSEQEQYLSSWETGT
ncbi:MAG: adenosylhomocysteinase, partial [Acidimicrobiia bacterium]